MPGELVPVPFDGVAVERIASVDEFLVWAFVPQESSVNGAGDVEGVGVPPTPAAVGDLAFGTRSVVAGVVNSNRAW